MKSSKSRQGEPPRSPNPDPNAPRNYNLPKCYLIKLTLRSQDSELPDQHTWTAGPGSAEGVVSRWKRENPTLAPLLLNQELVTPVPEKRVIYPYLQPKGPRQKVADPLLERAAKNMRERMLVR